MKKTFTVRYGNIRWTAKCASAGKDPDSGCQNWIIKVTNDFQPNDRFELYADWIDDDSHSIQKHDVAMAISDHFGKLAIMFAAEAVEV